MTYQVYRLLISFTSTLPPRFFCACFKAQHKFIFCFVSCFFLFCFFFMRYCLTRSCTHLKLPFTTYGWKVFASPRWSLICCILQARSISKWETVYFESPLQSPHTSPSSVVLSARCSSQRIQTYPVWNLWNCYFCYKIFHSLRVTQRTWGGNLIRWSALSRSILPVLSHSDASCARCFFASWNRFKHLKDCDTSLFLFLVTQALAFDWANGWKAQNVALSLCRWLRLMKLRKWLEEDG